MRVLQLRHLFPRRDTPNCFSVATPPRCQNAENTYSQGYFSGYGNCSPMRPSSRVTIPLEVRSIYRSHNKLRAVDGGEDGKVLFFAAFADRCYHCILYF